MSGFLAAPLMLWGLVGLSIPVAIHLLNRRRAETIDWGAMQFLDVAPTARRKLRLQEMLLLAGRMLLLALVVLAVARPSWQPTSAAGSLLGGPIGSRDYVLILDGSDSMERSADGTNPRTRAIAWARQFVATLGPDAGVAVVLAKDCVRPLFDGFRRDHAQVDAALKDAPISHGSSDLPAALAEAFRMVESSGDRYVDILILGDHQRHAWRPGDAPRWTLLRDLHRALQNRAPRIWSLGFANPSDEGTDAALGPLEIARGVYPPEGLIPITTTFHNIGAGAAARSLEMLVDGVPVAGSSQKIGPVPSGGKVPVTLRTSIAQPGSHLLTVRLSGGDDPLPGNDSTETPVEIADALPVLIVDGEPGAAPFSGESDFLRAALAPREDAAPAIRVQVIRSGALTSETLKNQRVLVLANVERLEPPQNRAVSEFLATGGGLLIAPGDRIDETFYRAETTPYLPASLGPLQGDFARKTPAAHPAPPSFTGPVFAPFGSGDSPPLKSAALFAYRVLEPTPDAAVVARLDAGPPWGVEKPFRSGRVLMLAGPLDAEGGTLPVNPDFVPLMHEIMFRLADPIGRSRPVRPGDSIRIDLKTSPPENVSDVPVRTPTGATIRAKIVREGTRARVQIDSADESGVYRVTLPPPLNESAYVLVASDPRESEPEPLAAAESAQLADGWPLRFDAAPERLPGLLRGGGSAGNQPLWRGFVLLALVGLCAEVWFTRRMVMGRAEGGS